MKTQATSGSNRDNSGKNKINKKNDKPTGTTIMLHKDETNLTIKRFSNPRKTMIKIFLNYHNNKIKIRTQQCQPQKTPTEHKDNSTEETTIIPETNPIPTTQQQEIFKSPSLFTNHRNDQNQETPEPNHISTPETTPTDIEDNNRKTPPKTKNQFQQEYKTFKAKKFTTKIQQTNFCDIGRLTNATKQEIDTIIAMSMYDRLGLYDPSNEYITNYKHTDVLNRYKEISKDRPPKCNNLLDLHKILQNIELRG